VNRREMLLALLGGAAALGGMRWLLTAAGESGGSGLAIASELPDGIEPLKLTDEQWRDALPEFAYSVLRKEGTERSGSSPLNKEKRTGHFVCAGCFLPLFRSETKFESGTGWPSFFDSIPNRVGKKTDFKLIVPRTEYHCIRCEGHQGHVFNDGPKPTGLRYCNNGVSLRFVPDGEELPPLRTAAG
jgi:peptide-methionine (R)-S-oxide reductase